MGKYATNGGVDVDRVTYSREAGATDSGTLSVFANSHLEGQSIQVSDTADPKHFDATTLRGAKGAYAAQVDFTGGVPATVKVTNAGDVPADSKDAKVVDAVTGEAIYDADTETLSVSAESSDKAEVPALTAEGLGDLPADGSDLVVTPLAAPPANVTVNSGAGGTATLPVQMTGAGFAPIPVMPFAGTNQEVVKGTTVQLDGTGSSGPIKTYSWKQLPGGPTVDLQNADTATPTFVAPDPAPDASTKLTFELTVDGPGGPLTATVDVTVFGAAAEIVVNAGPDQTVTQGGAVTLDATGSSPEAKTFSWKQAGAPTDPQVTLTGADTATPKFTFPKTNATLTFEVTASGGGGSATDTVQVTAPADRLTLSRAQFTRSNNEWRIEGSSNVFGPGVSVTAYPGPTATGTPINAAPAAVDTLGAFRIRLSGVPAALRPVNNAAFGPANQQTITLKSTSGGTLTASFTVK
jgi:hypothetical protein